ncbi:MAG TPA: diguanylate cyclase [Thermoleophilaceae bacterium]|nr:diguanylate cyclase [Thermoleophilaceae bacterium]
MSDVSHISARNRARLLLAAAVLVIAVSVWGVSAQQRSTADRVFDETRSAHQMLAAMLDQETGVRGFALTRQDTFLEPYRRGTVAFERALRRARALVHEDDTRRQLEAQAAAARRWHRLADEELLLLRMRPDQRFNLARAEARKRAFDRFRTLNGRLSGDLAAERKRELGRAGAVSAGVTILLALLFGGLGYVVIERQARRGRDRRAAERRYRETQSEFAETIQIMRDEDEAHALVKHHLEREIDGAHATALVRNNSDDRLVAATPVEPDSPLAAGLVDASPESCLAVRLARPYDQGQASAPLLPCKLCGKSAPEVTCVPSLVSGEVIGSLLVQRDEPLETKQRDRVVETIGQASPVLANLRNLAIAETRASTDALTGLPNSRSCRDNLKRMVAAAGRTLSPCTAILLDLDHFKQINDRFGHGAGDDVLAAVGDVMRSTLRDSDFAGRYGGEEFLMLLPDTDHEGGLQAAEKVREAVQGLDLAQVDGPVTASLGVAAFPADAMDSDTLVRQADRALYAAKAAGRNQVMLALPGAGALPEGAES